MNLFEGKVPIKSENFTTLLEHKNIKIVRIVSSYNIEHNEYCQSEDEWVVIVQGSAVLEIGNQEQKLSQGESIFIAAHTKHTLKSVQEGTIWLAVHIY